MAGSEHHSDHGQHPIRYQGSPQDGAPHPPQQGGEDPPEDAAQGVRGRRQVRGRREGKGRGHRLRLGDEPRGQVGRRPSERRLARFIARVEVRAREVTPILGWLRAIPS